MTIQVTKEHIKKGRRNSPCACPIALALKETVKGARVNVGGYAATLRFGGGMVASARLGKKGSTFVGHFDDYGREGVNPIKLNLKFIVQ